jgi:hypothetical protein
MNRLEYCNKKLRQVLKREGTNKMVGGPLQLKETDLRGHIPNSSPSLGVAIIAKQK